LDKKPVWSKNITCGEEARKNLSQAEEGGIRYQVSSAMSKDEISTFLLQNKASK
jgi:hypothetical protein